MRKKLKNNIEVESSKFKVKSEIKSFNFKFSALNFIIASLIALLIVTCASKDAAHEHADTYTCPMHPTVVSDKPGVCPVCAMDLVRKARPGEEVQITEDLAKLIRSTNEVVVANVKTVRGEFKSMPVQLSLKGIVTYDERQVFSISSRVGGRLEKVFLKYVFQRVNKGQKIAEVYSPELVNAQRELLYLLKNDSENKVLIESAEKKLLLLGMTEQQLNELKLNQNVAYTFSVYSPYSGYVISETQKTPAISGSSVTPSPMQGGGMGMNSNSSSNINEISTATSDTEFIRAGSYVNAGQTMFRIVNTAKMWIEFNVPVMYSSQIKLGDELMLDRNGKKETIKIDFVEPFFNEGEDFVKVRSYVNGNDFMIGQLIETSLTSQTAESFWLPQKSVLDMGNERIVFLKQKGVFKPKKVTTGVFTNGFYEIKSGLASSDEVAAEAHYLIDSEDFIKTSK